MCVRDQTRLEAGGQEISLSVRDRDGEGPVERGRLNSLAADEDQHVPAHGAVEADVEWFQYAHQVVDGELIAVALQGVAVEDHRLVVTVVVWTRKYVKPIDVVARLRNLCNRDYTYNSCLSKK